MVGCSDRIFGCSVHSYKLLLSIVLLVIEEDDGCSCEFETPLEQESDHNCCVVLYI